MAHLFETGFSVREPAWHGLAEVLDHYPGREEAMMKAGHNWTLEDRPVVVDGEEVKSWKALRRSDTGAILAVVKDSYEVIQNAFIWDILDAIMQQPDVKYETAGVLDEGRRVWALAKLDEPWKVPGDDSYTAGYINVGAAHDGSRALEAMAMNVRVVCMNTYIMAKRDAQKRGYYYSFRHTKNVQERLEQARESLACVRDQFQVFRNLSMELAKHPVGVQGMTEFVDQFIPYPKDSFATPRAVTFVEQARAEFAAIMGGRTVPEAHKRTAYGLFCAGVEFLDHTRQFRSNETYFNRTTEPNRMKDSLAKLALKVAD